MISMLISGIALYSLQIMILCSLASLPPQLKTICSDDATEHPPKHSLQSQQHASQGSRHHCRKAALEVR